MPPEIMPEPRTAEKRVQAIMSAACDHDDGYALCTGAGGCQETAKEIVEALNADVAQQVEAALAAHRAVVWELAEALEAAQNSLCASTDYQKVPSNRYGLERIRAALAHPLVRKGTT